MLITLSNGHLSAKTKFALVPVRIHTLTGKDTCFLSRYFVLHRISKTGVATLIGKFDRDMVELSIQNELEASSKESNLRVLK
jgi:hypothetical protein